MFNQQQVTQLVEALGAMKIDPGVEIEPGQFGLSAHLFDPVSGQIITLAQPHRVDVGQPEILLTPTQAAGAVATARATHLHNIRAAGYLSIEQYNEAQVQLIAASELAHKQALERAELDRTQGEAKVKAVADAAPKKDAASTEASREQQDEAANRNRQEQLQRGDRVPQPA